MNGNVDCMWRAFAGAILVGTALPAGAQELGRPPVPPGAFVRPESPSSVGERAFRERPPNIGSGGRAASPQVRVLVDPYRPFGMQAMPAGPPSGASYRRIRVYSPDGDDSSVSDQRFERALLTHLEQGRYDEALSVIAPAIRENPEDGRLLLLTSQLLVMLGDYGKSHLFLMEGLGLSAAQDWNFPFCGQPYELQKNRAYLLEVDALQAFTARHPNACYAAVLYAYYLAGTGCDERALHELSRLAELDPSNVPVWEMLRVTELRMKGSRQIYESLPSPIDQSIRATSPER